MDVETLVSEATVEALAEDILDRLARIDELQLDVVLVGPLIENLARQFWSVIEHDGLGGGAVVDELVEHLNHPSAGKRRVDLDRQGFTGAGVQHGERTDRSSRGYGITDEVETPALIGLMSHSGLDPSTDGHALPWASAHRKAFVPIQPMNPFVIHPMPLPSQQHMESSIAKARTLGR